MNEATRAVPTSVYRYYDRHGMLIYVGITSRAVQRNREHNRDKTWWQYVATQEVDHYATREEAHAREVELIQSHTPPYNAQHNRQAADARRAYERLVAGGVLAQQVDDLLSACGNMVPLGLSPARNVGDIELRTHLAFAPVALAVEHVRPMVKLVTANIGGVGHVLDVERRGPIAVFVAQIRQGVTFETAAAEVRKLSISKGSIRYGVKRILLTGAKPQEAA